MKKQNTVKIEKNDFLNLSKIMDSGQCFRMSKEGNVYHITAFQRELFIEEEEKILKFSADEVEYETIWKKYFDMDTDYEKIAERIEEKDVFLKKAEESARGIRILRQEPFEMLITFIISQRKTIPAIKKSVESLSELAGKEIRRGIYAFPEPESLSKLSMEELKSCGLGYRAAYIKETAERVVNSPELLSKLENFDDTALHRELKIFKGVGDKVADCVRLFGYHRLNAFPKDVWINRVLEENYKNGFPFEKYAPYNGVMQQYLFYYRRLL